MIWELNESSRRAGIHRHDKVEVKTAGPYTQLSKTFTTSRATTQVRFILDTAIKCPYQEGHVTYDDCSLSLSSMK